MPNTGLELLQQGEIWIEEPNGEVTFYHTKVIFTSPAGIHYATPERRFPVDVPIPLHELLADSTIIPNEQVRPAFEGTGLTRAPFPFPEGTYLKRPSLLNHAEGDHSIAALVLEEARTCEEFIKNPHTNIAKYHGCYVSNGRISGLVFDRYEETLDQRKDTPALAEHLDEWYEGIKAGLEHLHKLGYVHNDVNPSNVMFSAGGHVPHLIDFDSARKEGGPLGIKTGTYGWTEEGGFKSSVRTNDDFGLAKIHDFLEAWKRRNEHAAKAKK